MPILLEIGNNGYFVKNSTGSLCFTFSGAIAEYEYMDISIDGRLLESFDDYYMDGERLYLGYTLLEQLDVGTHTIKFDFMSDSVEYQFDIMSDSQAAKPIDQFDDPMQGRSDSVKTTALIWVGIAVILIGAFVAFGAIVLLAIIGAVVAIIIIRKKRKK